MVQFHDGFITVDIPYERIDAAAPDGYPKKYSYRYDEREKTTQDDKKHPKIRGKHPKIKRRPKIKKSPTPSD